MGDTNSRVITAVWLRIPFFWNVTLLHRGIIIPSDEASYPKTLNVVVIFLILSIQLPQ